MPRLAALSAFKDSIARPFMGGCCTKLQVFRSFVNFCRSVFPDLSSGEAQSLLGIKEERLIVDFKFPDPVSAMILAGAFSSCLVDVIGASL